MNLTDAIKITAAWLEDTYEDPLPIVHACHLLGTLRQSGLDLPDDANGEVVLKLVAQLVERDDVPRGAAVADG